MTYEQRKEKAIQKLNEGKLAHDVFGQLACHNFDDEIYQKAIERKWISEELAKELLK